MTTPSPAKVSNTFHVIEHHLVVLALGAAAGALLMYHYDQDAASKTNKAVQQAVQSVVSVTPAPSK